MTRRQKVAYAIILTLIFLAASWNDAGATVYEDDPRWNCRTMGNQVCGVDPVFGTWSIVRGGRLYV